MVYHCDLFKLFVDQERIHIKSISARQYLISFFLMARSNWLNRLKFNLHSPGIASALIILPLTQIAIALKTCAELACIGELSNLLWKKTKSHKGVNVVAVRSCNGGGG